MAGNEIQVIGIGPYIYSTDAPSGVISGVVLIIKR